MGVHQLLLQGHDAAFSSSERCVVQGGALAGEQRDSPDSRKRLFFAQASPEASEEHLSAWFSQYGVVEQIELYKDNSGSGNPGYGYISMGNSEQAAAALNAAQQNPQGNCPVKYLNLSCPVTVAVEDSSAQNSSPHTNLVANADRTVRIADELDMPTSQDPAHCVQVYQPTVHSFS